MNRRNFLKRAAAVVAGAVAVPTIASTLTTQDVMNAAQVPWGGITVEQATELARMTLKDMPTNIWDEIPKHPIGTRYYATDGQIFVYAKAVNGFTKVGELC